MKECVVCLFLEDFNCFNCRLSKQVLKLVQGRPSESDGSGMIKIRLSQQSWASFEVILLMLNCKIYTLLFQLVDKVESTLILQVRTQS